MFGLIFFWIIIYITTICFSILLNKKFGTIIPIVCISFALITYVFTVITKNLSLSTYITILVSVIFWIITIFKKRKKAITLFKENCIRGSFLYIIITAISIIIALWHGEDPIFFDEFMHWGNMCKNMFNLNYFYITNDVTFTIHNEYPPIVQLWNTLTCILDGKFNLTFCYAQHYLLCLVFFVPATEIAKSKKTFIMIILIIAPLTILLPFASDDGQPSLFLSLLNDTIFGIVAGYVLYKTFKYSFKVFESIELCLILCFLVLIKQISVVYFFIVGIFLLIKLIKTRSKKNLLFLFIICFSVVVCWSSWYFTYNTSELATNLINNNQTPQFNFEADRFFSVDETYIKGVCNAFISGIFNIQLIGYAWFIKINFLYEIIFIFSIFFLTSLICRKKINFIMIFMMLTTLIIYLSTILFSYIYLFKGNEGLDAFCFIRYMNTLTLSLEIFIFYYCLELINNNKNYIRIYIFVLIICYVFFAVCCINIHTFDYYRYDCEEPKEIAKRIDENAEKGSTTFILSDYEKQDNNTLLLLMCSYYQNSGKINMFINSYDFFKVGQFSYSNTTKNFKDCFNSCDYVYINNNSSEFWDNYSYLFSKKEYRDKALYKVNWVNDKIDLEPIEYF